MALPSRAEVAEEEVWDLTQIFVNEEAFHQAIVDVEEVLNTLNGWRERELTTAADVLLMLQIRDDFVRRVLRLNSYTSLKLAEDAANSASQALAGRNQQLMDRVNETLAAVRAKVSKLSVDQLERFRSEEQHLEPYRYYLDETVRDTAHRLSDEGEAVLANLSSLAVLPPAIYGAAIAGDAKYTSVTDSTATEVAATPFQVLFNIETSTDTQLRRQAYRALSDGLRPYQHTLATALSAQIQRDVTTARMRKYSTVFHMLQNESDELNLASKHVSPDHFFMVQDILGTKLAAHMRRYARLRKRVLGLDQTLLCDVKAPLEPLQNSPISWTEVKDIILQAAKPLGAEYEQILRRAFGDHWIYRAQNIGQLNGAFCDFSDVHPYVFAPYSGGLYNILMVGHELGHAVHGALTTMNQNPANWRMSTLFIEAPSTLMEHFIVAHLRREHADPAFKRRLTQLHLLTYHHNFVTHHLEAEILRRLYTAADAGISLTTDQIRNTSRQTLADFWGNDVELDESADLYWMRQSHYYAGIYSYTYAVGLVGSTMIARRIMDEGDPAVADWIEVLKSGGTQTPMELFAKAGIDMTKPEPYLQAVAYVGELIDELERAYP